MRGPQRTSLGCNLPLGDQQVLYPTSRSSAPKTNPPTLIAFIILRVEIPANNPAYWMRREEGKVLNPNKSNPCIFL